MKSLSCITLPLLPDRTRPVSPPSDPHSEKATPTPHKHAIDMDLLGNKGSSMSFFVDILRCEFARPAQIDHPVDARFAPSKSWSKLHYAAYYGREAAVLHYLHAGHSPDGNAKNGELETPLLVAVAAGHLGTVRLLCAAGASLEAVTRKDGETALHVALRLGKDVIVDVLMAHGPDLDARTTSTGETPLHVAIKVGSRFTVEKLLAQGPDVNTQTHAGDTPLHYAAARTEFMSVVDLLLAKGANVEVKNCEGRTAAEIAVVNGNIPAAVAIVGATKGKRGTLAKEKELLLRYVDNPQNRSSLGDELLTTIYEAGCEPESTALIAAIRKTDLALVEPFLRRGADPNQPEKSGLSPVFAALHCTELQILQLLVNHGADVKGKDPKGRSTLYVALESARTKDKDAVYDVFQTLLKAGADPKEVSTDGKTLLHHAVSLGQARIAVALISRGLGVNDIDNSGSSALHYASRSKACMDLLIRNGADQNLANNERHTPLHSAILASSPEDEPNLDPLIKASNLRAVDKHGKTALHHGAERGLLRTVRNLLKCRAQLTVTDSQGRTPLILAAIAGQWPIIPLLAVQPGINCWDESGMTALHYIVTQTPKPPATWNDIASAASKFCDRGISRTLRNRVGSTPLIAAVIALPEEGVPVIEALLSEKGTHRGSGRVNCIAHEDHRQRSALYHAATNMKPAFVRSLLRHGAPFSLEDWSHGVAPAPETPKGRQVFKLLAEHDCMRRSRTLNRRSGQGEQTTSVPEVLSASVLSAYMKFGLNPNAMPASRPHLRGSLLWTVLNYTSRKSPLPEDYLHDVLTVLLQHGADPSVVTAPKSNVPVLPETKPRPPTRDVLTFLLEEHPDIKLDTVVLLVDRGALLTTCSPVYEGRYPLHAAVKANRLDVVLLYLDSKADPNVLGGKKRSPIFLAAERGFGEIVNALLERGARVDLNDSEENTVLHVASSAGHADIVSRLMRAGAKALVENKQGEKPSDRIPETLGEAEKSKIDRVLKDAEAREAGQMGGSGGSKRLEEVEQASQERAEVREEEEVAKAARQSQHNGNQQAQNGIRENPRPPQTAIRDQRHQCTEPGTPSHKHYEPPSMEPRELQIPKLTAKQTMPPKPQPTLTRNTVNMHQIRNGSPPQPTPSTNFTPPKPHIQASKSTKLFESMRSFTLSFRHPTRQQTRSEKLPAVPLKLELNLPPPNPTPLISENGNESKLQPPKSIAPRQPRTDSGFGYAKSEAASASTLAVDKPLPAVNACAKEEKGTEQGKEGAEDEELKAWLKASRLLERL